MLFRYDFNIIEHIGLRTMYVLATIYTCIYKTRLDISLNVKFFYFPLVNSHMSIIQFSAMYRNCSF